MSGRNGLPIVAIPLRPDLDSSARRLYQKRVYFDAIEAAGAAVMPIPLTADEDRVRAVFERCDALCLPGGPDVEPERYGERPQPGFGVESAPKGLRVTARAPDGIVEAVEAADHVFALGIQSHPEELTAQHSWASRLFEEFVARARA